MLSLEAKERVLEEVLRIAAAGELRPASEQEKRTVAEMNEAIELLRELDEAASPDELPYELSELAEQIQDWEAGQAS